MKAQLVIGKYSESEGYLRWIQRDFLHLGLDQDSA